MNPALIYVYYAAAFSLATVMSAAMAGIDLVTEPNESTEKIELEIEDYVPFSGIINELTSDEKEAIIRACDDHAAHPGNEENPEAVEGVSYDALDGSKALPACLKAVKSAPNDPRMRYQLARAKQASGQGRDAIKDLTELANEGYVAAINNLGATYQIGIGVKRDYTKAFRWYQQAAKKDFVPSMAILGWMYHTGSGTEKDSTKAVEWYQKAAAGDSASAMHDLGHMYNNGWGIDADPEKAAMWFHRSAKAGFGQGMAMTAWTYQVGQGVTANGEEAIKWYKKAADVGELSAVGALGGFYDAGGSNTPPRPEKAAEWLLRAVMEGHIPTRKRLIDTPESLQAATRRAIQTQLTALGFDAGPADGVFGAKTRQAIDSAFETP